MEQIIIQVKDKEKAQLLSELLRSLDFVSLVTTDFQENDSGKTKADFFALAGIWQGRNIDLDTIRQQAWPK
ncbi:MAG: hypothetical protein KBE23_12455 [Chloroflexi bacterium]|nr:hypothetical protein [Chloroflexota bacterium]MBP7043549.1 hypothetical protein [Chloroflexota bacterium]